MPMSRSEEEHLANMQTRWMMWAGDVGDVGGVGDVPTLQSVELQSVDVAQWPPAGTSDPLPNPAAPGSVDGLFTADDRRKAQKQG